MSNVAVQFLLNEFFENAGAVYGLRRNGVIIFTTNKKLFKGLYALEEINRFEERKIGHTAVNKKEYYKLSVYNTLGLQYRSKKVAVPPEFDNLLLMEGENFDGKEYGYEGESVVVLATNAQDLKKYVSVIAIKHMQNFADGIKKSLRLDKITEFPTLMATLVVNGKCVNMANDGIYKTPLQIKNCDIYVASDIDNALNNDLDSWL